MAAYLIRRLWQIVPTLMGVVLLVFVLFKGFGGDPAEILAGLDEIVADLELKRYGLEMYQSDVLSFSLFRDGSHMFLWKELDKTLREIERYSVWPGQATAYKTGALTIQRLRDKAQAALGDKFDIREFHAEVLGTGALPLAILEQKIDRWIAEKRGS